MNIRETILLIWAVIMTVLSSCEPIPADRYSFDLPVGPGSEGSNTVSIGFFVSAIRLTGVISATEGTLFAEVISPSGFVAFTATVEAPGELQIDRSFVWEEGVWRMRYRSPGGTGYIRMHLSLVR